MGFNTANADFLVETPLRGSVGMGGKVFMVSSSSGGNYNELIRQYLPDFDGELRFFTTVALANTAVVANRGDVVFIAPGYTETISGAAGTSLTKAGSSWIGLGVGSDRPTFTFGTSTSASLDITGNGIKVRNIVGVAGIDGLTKAFNVTGDFCDIEIEWQDASAAVEAATAVRLDTANNCKLSLVYKGFTAGNATTSAVKLDDCDNVLIHIDAYGVVSTAWVDMVDVASTNVSVRGRMYTQGITNFTRDVVDTITGSTWDAVIFDASFGGLVSGGSAAALASDDVAAVATSLATLQAEVSGAAGITSFPASAAPANGVSLAEVIRAIYDATNGVDGSTNVLGANDSDNGFSSSSVVANRDGSVLERLEALMDPTAGYNPRMGFSVTKVSNLADGSGTDNLFDISGRVLITSLTGEVTTVIGGAATLKIRDITNSVDLCAATTIDTDAVGTMYALSSISANILNGTGMTPVVGSIPNLTGSSHVDVAIVGDAQASLTLAQVLDAADTGNITWVLTYIPLVSGATVTAAA